MWDSKQLQAPCWMLLGRIYQSAASAEILSYLELASYSTCLVCRNSTASNSSRIEVMELLVRISTRQSFLTTMNSSLDFSFVDTSRTSIPITNSTTIVPRQAEPNTRLPAYLDSKLAWGGLPSSVGSLLQHFFIQLLDFHCRHEPFRRHLRVCRRR